jgi:hypothetical protein
MTLRSHQRNDEGRREEGRRDEANSDGGAERVVDLAELPQNKPSYWFLKLKDIFDHDSDNSKDSARWIEGLQNSMDRIIAATVRRKAHREVQGWAKKT